MRATPHTHTQRSVRVPSPPPGWWPELGGGGFGSEQGKTPGPPAAGTGERFFRGQVAGGGGRRCPPCSPQPHDVSGGAGGSFSRSCRTLSHCRGFKQTSNK